MSNQLIFDIQGYWRAGTGKGGGSLYDESVQKDVYGLPLLPGRTVKGLLRDACWRLEQWEQLDEGTTRKLFGIRFTPEGTTIDQKQDDSPEKPKAGLIRVSNAELETETRQYLQSLILSDKDDNKGYFRDISNQFFRMISSTAIENGSAKDKSLRTSEVTIPLKLIANISINEDKKENQDYWKVLEKCLPLIRAIGNNRTRGLGRTLVTLNQQEAQ